jgi:hypothetical protein
MWVHGDNLCKVYNYHDSRACGYKWFGILSRLDGMVLGMVWDPLEIRWYGFGNGWIKFLV